MSDLPNGLDALMEVLSLKQIMNLIEDTAKWVSPNTFNALPVWYPEYHRKAYFYKENWSVTQMNKNRQTGISVHKQEGNTRANEALTRALGLTKQTRPNWSCCHIWGSDDLTYQEHNAIIQDPKYYSCVANMVLMPSPLKAFTDALIDVKTMLRICAQNTFGWICEHESAEDARRKMSEFSDWDLYPNSWPRKLGEKPPKGTVPFNSKIAESIGKRKLAIATDLSQAGEYYPKKSVEDSLAFWDVKLEVKNVHHHH